MYKIVKCLIVALTITTAAKAQESLKPTETTDYKPEIHGTIRAKYEYQPEISSGRFEVRNARFSITGKLSPVISYKAEVDLSDEGNIKMLDAYARYEPIEKGNFTIGQMRVPFTIDAHRSPHQQYFVNRSFIAKQVGNVRDVGATLAYKLDAPFPITLEGGLFNGSGLTNQKNFWADKMNYSAKVQLQVCPIVNFVLSTQAIKPDSFRINMFDAGITFKVKQLTMEAEFLYKKYEKDAFDEVKAFDSFVNYDIPLKRVFQKVSLLARYDYMSDHSDGKTNSNGELTLTDAARKRVTGGVTLSLNKPFISDIRINYEKYFYDSGASVKISEQDKFAIEFMTRF